MYKCENLSKKYPEIFSKCNLGISVGDGWYDLLDRLCATLQLESNRLGDQVYAEQVKEKFGGLRFYYTCNNYQAFDEFIQEAEKEAYKTCEFCGKPGKITQKGWVKVLCEACEVKK